MDETLKEYWRKERQNGDVTAMRLTRVLPKQSAPFIVIEKTRTFIDRNSGEPKTRRMGFSKEDIIFLVEHNKEIIDDIQKSE